MRHNRILIILLAIFAFGSSAVYGEDTLKEKEGVDLLLKDSDLLWQSDGSGEAVLYMQLTNPQHTVYSGELRMVVMAINGRIEFDKVQIKRLYPLAKSEEACSTFYKKNKPIKTETKKGGGVYAEAAIQAGQEAVTRCLYIYLPPGAKQPDVIIQLLAFYRGQDEQGNKAVVKSSVFFKPEAPPVMNHSEAAPVRE